jgi:hypothetical protein
MFDLMQYALIFYDFQLILARMGAHLLGPHAAEVINIFAVAIRCGIRATELKQVLCASPTSASDLASMLSCTRRWQRSPSGVSMCSTAG